MSNLRHNNIGQFSGVVWDPPDFGLAMPLVHHGSLDSFTKKYHTVWQVKVMDSYYFEPL